MFFLFCFGGEVETPDSLGSHEYSRVSIPTAWFHPFNTDRNFENLEVETRLDSQGLSLSSDSRVSPSFRMSANLYIVHPSSRGTLAESYLTVKLPKVSPDQTCPSDSSAFSPRESFGVPTGSELPLSDIQNSQHEPDRVQQDVSESKSA